MKEKFNYLFENMGVSDALGIVGGSIIKATFCTAVIVAFVALGFFDSLIVQTIPYAIAPCIAIAYIAKKWYDTLTKRLLVGLLTGFVFGLLIRSIGIILVLLVDVIGLQMTVFAVVVESVSLLAWLYMDLTSWVKSDAAYRMREAERKNKQENP